MRYTNLYCDSSIQIMQTKDVEPWSLILITYFSTSDGEVKESFWISKEYFDLAHEYYSTQLEAATSESDTIRSD